MRKLLCLLSSVCLAVCVAGCDTQPLKEKLIVEGVAVDYVNQQYQVTVQVYAPSADNTARSDFQLFTAMGDTVYQALRRIDENTGKHSYFSDTQVVIFSHQSLMQGIWPALEYFIRSSEMSTNVCMAVTMEQAKELFHIEKEGINMPSKVLSNLLHYGKTDAAPFSGEMMTVGARLLGEDGDVAFPVLQVEQREDKKYPRLNGVLCFRKTTPHYVMNEQEKWVYNWLQEYGDDRAYVVSFQGTDHTVNIKNTGAEVQVALGKKGPAFHICLTMECDVMETGTPHGVILEQVEAFEQALSRQIEQQVTHTVTQVLVREGCDVFRLVRSLRRQYPDYFRGLTDWRTAIAHSTVTCEVAATLTRAGQGTVE